MNVPVTNGLVLRLETDQGLLSSGTTITNWTDLSPFGNDLSALGDPSIGSVFTPSGAVAVELDGEGDALERLTTLASGLPDNDEDRTIFFVVDYENPQGVYSGAVYGRPDGNRTYGLVAESDGELGVQGYGATNDVSSGVDGVSGGFLVQSAVLSSNQLTQFLNGELIASDTKNFNTRVAGERLVIGQEIGGSGFGDMNVSAVLIYDRALDETERADVEAYLQAKYLTDDGLDNAPVAVGEAIQVPTGETVEIDILANDIDEAALDGSAVTIIAGPDHGAYSLDPITGVITYVHDGGADTADSISYTVTDVNGNVSEEATIDMEVGFFGYDLNGFSDSSVLTRGEMNAESSFFLPISMTFLPDNRMLLLSKDGEILLVDPESGNSTSLLKLQNIESTQERGLLDITIDPDFETNGYFYLFYTPSNPQNARISRFTFEENSGGLTSDTSLASEMVVWQDTDGYLACCHYGGGLDFGPDGKLWLTSSDKFQVSTPGEGQNGGLLELPLDLASSSGKIIRVNSDGTVPDGTDGQPANPWADPADGINDYIWAYGLRNPFRARWDEEYGNFYIGEVGGNQQNIAHDDVHISNLDHAGAFYGWPFYEGTTDTYVNKNESTYDPNDFPLPDGDPAAVSEGDFYSSPIWSLPHEGITASLTGGEVYRGDMFPEEWGGVYFYGDYTRDYLRYIVLDETGTQPIGDFAFKPSAQLPGTTNEVVSIAVGNDGALYYAMISSGEIRRITYSSDAIPNSGPEIDSAALSLTTGALPLDVTFNASVSDVDGDTLSYSINFGDGTIVADTVPIDGLISVGHTYVTDGRFDVSLSVSDGSATSFSAPFEVTAGDFNEAPIISSAGPDVTQADPGMDVEFNATVSDSNGDPLTYSWYFGDGNSISGNVALDGTISIDYAYSIAGDYDTFLQVSDGLETVLTSDVTIQIGDPGLASDVPVGDGLVLLLQSDIKIGLGDGNTVTAWLDGSGQGNNLFAAGDPQLETGRTPTGQSAIVFDGASDVLQRINAQDTIFNLPAGNADRTVFFVVNYIDDMKTNAGLIYGDAASNEAFGLISSRRFEELELYGYGNDFDSDVDAVSPGWLVQSVVLDNDEFEHYLNGTLIDSGIHTFDTDLQRLVLGGNIEGNDQNQLEIAAALVYDRALSEAERQDVEEYLQIKYITGDPGSPPIAQDDGFAAPEDSVISGNVLADNGNGADSDPDGDPLTVSLVSGPAAGVLVLNPDGSFAYTPDADSFGTDSFVYEVTDGTSTDQATVTLDVTPVDDPAVAVADSYVTDRDTPLSVAAGAGVLANDSDAEGDPFTASLTDDVDNGTLLLNADGSFDYTPVAGFSGTDSFTYQLEGGSTATVSIDVIDPASVPQATDDSFSGPEDSVISGNVLADNGNGADSDPDGDPLTVSLVSGPAAGVLVLNPDGSFAYTPDADSFGTDSFVYEVTDGTSTDQATVTLDVTPVDDPAVAVADSYVTDRDTPLSVAAGAGVLANDSDAEGDPFTASLTDDVDNGTLLLNADGSFDYTPVAGFSGTDSFTYQLEGGSTATVSIDVLAPGEALVLDGLVAAYEADENVSLADGMTVSGWLDGSGRGNDLVALGDPQLETGRTPTGQSAIVFDGASDTLERINATDALNGLPAGNADRTVFFVVNYIDDMKTNAGLIYGDAASNEAFGLISSRRFEELELYGYGNDFDSDVDAVSPGWLVQSVVLDNDEFEHYLNGTLIDSGIHTFDTDLQRLVLGGNIEGNDQNQLEIAAALVYDRALSEAERQDVEEYLQIKYITGDPGSPPIAQDDGFAAPEDSVISGNVLADNGNGADSDPDGDPLTVSLVSGPAAGVLVLNPDGSFAYTPDADSFGTDSFVYEVTDGTSTDQATVTLDVTPVDDPAVAVADSYVTDRDTPLSVAAGAGVLANDSDAEGDPFTASLTDDVDNGTLLLNADGSFDYTPVAGFSGTDSFTYQLEGGSTATVSIDVIDPASVPQATDDSFSGPEDSVISGNVLADNGNGADSDPDGDPLTVSLVSGPAAGVLVLNPDGSFAYTPDADSFGTDSFVYEVTDGTSTDQATVTLDVTPVDDPAVAVADSYVTDRDTPLSVAAGAGVLANDSDAEGDPFTASLTDDVDNGTLLLNADGSFDYTPVAGFSGTDSFTYQLEGGSTATVSIDVLAPGEALVLDGLVAAYEADENVSLADGMTVSGWLDGSGRGNDLVALGDPQLETGRTPTGQSAIVFDGASDTLERINATDALNGLPAGNADRTVFFVVNYIDDMKTNAGLIYGDAASNEAFGLISSRRFEELELYGYGNDFDSDVDAVSPGWLVQSVVLDNDEFEHYLNGTLIDSGIHTFDTDLQRLVLGGNIEGNDQNQLEIAAALVYDRALSEAERQDVEEYLQIKYITGDPGSPPIAQDDGFAAPEDSVISGNVLADNGNGADSDPDGDPLTVSLVSGPAAGVLVLNPDGSFAYTPDADSFGTDSFVYEVTDGTSTDQATVTLDVTPVDDPAVAVADSYVTDRDTPLSVAAGAGVLANDSDAEGDPFTASLTDDVDNGTLLLNADGSFDYTPVAGFSGTDSFTYQLEGGSTATVSIDVIDPASVPQATDDSFSGPEDSVISGNVLADNGNGADSDPDGDPLTVSLVSGPAAGVLVLNPDGSFAYTPDADSFGTDSFVYEVTDGTSTDQATVTLDVTPVDDPAVAVADSYVTDRDTPLSVAAGAGVLANDSDAEGDPFTASLTDDVDNGTLLLNADGSFDYTPVAGFSGTDSFTYQLEGGSTATVSIDVLAPGEALVLDGLVAAYEADENVSLADGMTVSGWLDGSGRGNDLVALGDPQLETGRTPTGQSAIVFDGASDTLERINATDALNGLPAGNADRTVFFVVNYIDDMKTNAGLIYGDAASNEAFGLISSRRFEELELYGYGNDFDSDVDAVSPGWLVQSVVLDNDEFEHYLNGTLIDSGIHTFDTDLQRLVLGGNIEGNDQNQLEIAAALVYDRALSEAERQDVEEYLQIKYIDDAFIFV